MYLFSKSSNKLRLKEATQSSLRRQLFLLSQNAQKLASQDRLSLLRMSTQYRKETER